MATWGQQRGVEIDGRERERERERGKLNKKREQNFNEESWIKKENKILAFVPYCFSRMVLFIHAKIFSIWNMWLIRFLVLGVLNAKILSFNTLNASAFNNLIYLIKINTTNYSSL